jgi:hypothetical protein
MVAAFVDYALVESSPLPFVQYFRVHNEFEAFSDHCMVSMGLELPTIIPHIPNQDVPTIPIPAAIKWDESSVPKAMSVKKSF